MLLRGSMFTMLRDDLGAAFRLVSRYDVYTIQLSARLVSSTVTSCNRPVTTSLETAAEVGPLGRRDINNASPSRRAIIRRVK